MPIYEYRCEACGRNVEIFLRTKEEAVRCPACGGEKLTKLLSTFSARGGDGASHDHAGQSCSCCPSAKSCPSARGS